jgi:hypothetical protein
VSVGVRETVDELAQMGYLEGAHGVFEELFVKSCKMDVGLIRCILLS